MKLELDPKFEEMNDAYQRIRTNMRQHGYLERKAIARASVIEFYGQEAFDQMCEYNRRMQKPKLLALRANRRL